MSNEIILMNNQILKTIEVNDCGEKLIDLTKKMKNVLISKYFTPPILLRESVVDKLIKARTMLPNGVDFLIGEGFRSTEAQQEYIFKRIKYLEPKYPNLNNSEIKEKVYETVAPIEIAPHLTGGAIDITLANLEGNELDLGTNFDLDDYFDQSCFTNYQNLTKLQKDNRSILVNALKAVGLVNYPAEWWHWSYGDRYWALMKKEKTAIFGPITSTF